MRSNILLVFKVVKYSWLKLSWLYLLKNTKQFVQYNCIHFTLSFLETIAWNFQSPTKQAFLWLKCSTSHSSKRVEYCGFSNKEKLILFSELHIYLMNLKWLVMHKLSSTDQELKSSTISSILISLLHLVNGLGQQIIQSMKILSFQSLERNLLLHVLFWAQELSLGMLITLFYWCAVLELLKV